MPANVCARGRLVAADRKADRTLREIFAAVDEGAPGVKGVALPLTTPDGECRVAHVLPLT